MISLFYGKNSNEDEREKKNNIKESSLQFYTILLSLNVIIAMKRKDETELMINEIIFIQITLHF